MGTGCGVAPPGLPVAVRGKLRTNSPRRGSAHWKSGQRRQAWWLPPSYREWPQLCSCRLSRLRVCELASHEEAWHRQHCTYAHLSREHFGKESAPWISPEGRISLAHWWCLQFATNALKMGHMWYCKPSTHSKSEWPKAHFLLFSPCSRNWLLEWKR